MLSLAYARFFINLKDYSICKIWNFKLNRQVACTTKARGVKVNWIATTSELFACEFIYKYMKNTDQLFYKMRHHFYSHQVRFASVWARFQIVSELLCSNAYRRRVNSCKNSPVWGMIVVYIYKLHHQNAWLYSKELEYGRSLLPEVTAPISPTCPLDPQCNWSEVRC